jgi:hypothetical protein
MTKAALTGPLVDDFQQKVVKSPQSIGIIVEVDNPFGPPNLEAKRNTKCV